MAAGYTKEFLINAFLYRYRSNMKEFLPKMANDSWDKWVAELGLEKGKKKFRDQCGLDADAIKEYKESLK